MPAARRQCGAVLITSLIILLVLTVIGVSAMSTSSLQERMAGNLRDQTMALQAAETGLKGAENTIDGWIYQPLATPTATNNVWTANAYSVIDTTAYNDSWWNTNGIEYGTAGAVDISGVYADPRTITQELYFRADGLDPDARSQGKGVTFYRDTSRAHGTTKHSIVILQSTYAKRFR